MLPKTLKLIFWTTSLVVATHVPAAYASGGEDGGNAQSPVQVIVQIVITAIALRVLAAFNLP